MILIENMLLHVNILDIIETLKIELKNRGISLFKKIKVGQDNIQVTCPYHKEGNENSPSCGISLKEKGNTKIGTVHCFTCGYTRTLCEMISDCFGFNDKGNYGKEWLKRTFTTSELDNRQIAIDFEITQNMPNYVSEEELSNYRYYHDYMFQRKLNEEVINRFDIGYDISQDAITFPVRDKNGNCLFVARRKVKIKNFNYPAGVSKPLYGIYELPSDCKEVIICESFFNCLTCYVYGKPAIALMGLGTNRQIEELKKLPFRKLILAFDGDEAGKKATMKLRKALEKTFIIESYILPEGKDINDLSEEEFKNLKKIT